MGEGYYIPNTRNGGSWDRTEPQSEIDNIRQSNRRSNGNTIKLIKMIKAWKHYCNVPIKSFAIELRAVNFLEKWKHYDQSATYYDWMIRDYFNELLNYVNYSCKIPGTSEKLSYGSLWESKAKTALRNAIKACEYESKDQPYNASDEWKKIFGSRFEY